MRGTLTVDDVERTISIMRRRQPSTRRLLTWLSAGALAGAVGTIAMDAVWYVRYRRANGTQAPLAWEFSTGVDGWEQVSAPGQVGKRLLTLVAPAGPPDRWARSAQNVMHWATGMGWGAPLGVVVGLTGRPTWAWGLVFGPAVWLASYATLAPAGIYKPIWQYDAVTLSKDFSAHLVYGLSSAAALAVLLSDG